MSSGGAYPATALALVAVRSRDAGGRAGPPSRRGRGGRRRVPAHEALLTVADVADQLNVSVTTVYRLILETDLPAAKVGPSPKPGRTDRRPWRIRQADVAKYMEGQMYDPLKGTWVADRERGRER